MPSSIVERAPPGPKGSASFLAGTPPAPLPAAIEAAGQELPGSDHLKSPPRQIRGDEAHDLVERFIERMAAGRAAGTPS